MMSTSFMEPQPDADRQRSSDKSKGGNNESMAMVVGMKALIWRLIHLFSVKMNMLN